MTASDGFTVGEASALWVRAPSAHQMMRRTVARLLVVPVVACGRGPDHATDSIHAAAPPAVARAETAATRAAAPSHAQSRVSSCPAWGNWEPCSVENRLTAAGLVVKRRDAPVRQSFLHVPGVVYDASNAEIQVYLYGTAADRARDTEQLDTVAVAPRGQTAVWKEPPTLVVSNNLAAVILTVNGRQAERISLALGAGMPLKPPPKP
jgi:hypothetical protein